MNKGVVLIVHDNGTVDYSALAILSARLVKKHLKVPVSIITDEYTLENLKQKINPIESLYDKVILTVPPVKNNKRVIFHGDNYKSMSFMNQTRSSIWELTPYERTLMIDVDYLIFSDSLSNYWQSDEDFLIASSASEVLNKRLGVSDKRISDTGPHMYWATTVMFTKNSRTKILFDLIEYIKENYLYFSEIYKFDTKTFRNDIAFSLAKHIIDGFSSPKGQCLPPVLTMFDKDLLLDVKNQSLKFIVHDWDQGDILIDIADRDIHFINKQTIIDNYSSLMELAE